jgi:hypothetical protein
MTEDTLGSPGGHPHSDRLNWQPATTADEYLPNCRELMAQLPKELFELLLANGLSSRAMAQVALALRRDNPTRMISSYARAAVKSFGDERTSTGSRGRPSLHGLHRNHRQAD